ncbi:hypothetical protein ACFX19_047758 [Malus domestica]
MLQNMLVKPSKVEGWIHVTLKKLRKKHMSSPQVHQSERGQSSFRQPPEQCESVGDNETLTQRSSSLSRCVTSSQKTSSTTQSRLFAMKIARNNSPGSLDEPQLLLVRTSLNCTNQSSLSARAQTVGHEAPCPQEPKLQDTKLLVCMSIKGNTNAPGLHEHKRQYNILIAGTSLNCMAQSSWSARA